MNLVELKMPKMGESMTEATIIGWAKKVGDPIAQEETLLEIATDKVDSEVPAPVSGTLQEIFYDADAVVEVGVVLATIAVGDTATLNQNSASTEFSTQETTEVGAILNTTVSANGNRAFFSPLVKSICKAENIGLEELENIVGTGDQGRVRKSDLIQYLSTRDQKRQEIASFQVTQEHGKHKSQNGKVRVIKMDRMRQMIAEHMVVSKHTAPHVTTFVEVDVTNLVQWRNKHKTAFFDKYGVKLTFTPIFIAATTKAIRDFPLINASVQGKEIHVHDEIHMGMAAALPSGNLIVPVIKNADEKNLFGLAKEVSDLTYKARNNKLSPDEIGGSSFTISNVGTFGSLMGTPIINQPEVAILATGTIKKRAEVLETENGDVIAIRQMMMLSLSFDHRAVDGLLGGSFLRKIADYLELFNPNQGI